MILAHIHFKSRKQIPVVRPWEGRDWDVWLCGHGDGLETIFASDEKGNQYIIKRSEVEFIMVPKVEDK